MLSLWPGSSLISRGFARKRALGARIRTIIRLSGSGFGCEADFGGPDTLRQRGAGPPKSALRLTSMSETWHIFQIPVSSALFRAKSPLFDFRAARGRPRWSASDRDVELPLVARTTSRVGVHTRKTWRREGDAMATPYRCKIVSRLLALSLQARRKWAQPARRKQQIQRFGPSTSASLPNFELVALICVQIRALTTDVRANS